MKQSGSIIRSLGMVLIFVALGVPAALIGIPWSAWRGNTDTMYAWARWIVRLGLRAAGIHVRAEGLENVPRGRPCILLSNHVSNLDPPVLIAVAPGQLSFLLKRELMKIPLLGTAMRMGKFVPVARSQSREDARRSTEAAAEALHAGLHLLVFPEGTRSADGRLLPFKKGAFFMAEATGALIVPIIVSGTAEMMPKGTNAIRSGSATVAFLQPIDPAKYSSREELMAAVRAEMEAAIQRS